MDVYKMTEVAYRLKADFIKALAHPTRLKIIELLRDGERCVCEMIPLLEVEQSNLSQHLATLRERGIVTARKEGLSVFYDIKDRRILDILSELEKVFLDQLEEARVVSALRVK